MSNRSEYQKRILKAIKTKKANSTVSNELKISKTNLKKYDVSAQQERILRNYIDKPEIPVAYNIPFAFRIKGMLDFNILRSSIEELHNENNALRTSFEVIDGKLVQIVNETKPNFEIKYIESDNKNSESTISECVNKFAIKSFSFKEKSFNRWNLFIIGKYEYILVFVVSHLISDGWSVSLIFEELSDNYNKIKNNEKKECESVFQFADYIEWYKMWKGTPSYNKQLNYWLCKLDKWKNPFIFEQICDDNEKSNGESFHFKIGKNTTLKSKRYSSLHKCSLFIFLLSVFNMLLNTYKKSDNITMAIPNANRSWDNSEKVVGFFSNDMIIRTYLGDSPDVSTVIERVRDEVMLAVENSMILFDDYFNILLPSADKHDMIRIKFNYTVRRISLKLSGCEVDEYKLDGKPATSDFNFVIIEDNSELSCCIEYNKGCFERDFIKEFCDKYVKLITDIIYTSDEEQGNILSL